MEYILDDILHIIFNGLTLSDNVSCQRVCKNFYKILKDKLSIEAQQKNGIEYATPYSTMYYSPEICVIHAINQREYKLALYELKRMPRRKGGRSRLLKLALKHKDWDIINYVNDNDEGNQTFYHIKTVYYKIRDKKIDINNCDKIINDRYFIYVRLLCALGNRDRVLFDSLWSDIRDGRFAIGIIGNRIAKKYDRIFNDSYPNLTIKLLKLCPSNKTLISTKNMKLTKFELIYPRFKSEYPGRIENIRSKLLYNCISHNNFDVFKYLINHDTVKDYQLSISYALAANKQYLHFMQYIVSVNKRLISHIIETYTSRLHPDMIYQIYHDSFFTKQCALKKLNQCVDYPYHANKIRIKIMDES
jgi:hypothetical protein